GAVLQAIFEGATDHELHDQVSVGGGDVEDLDQVRVVQAGGEPRLPGEALPRRAALGGGGGQELEGDDPAGDLVDGLVDPAAGAGAEEPADPVAAGHQLASTRPVRTRDAPLRPDQIVDGGRQLTIVGAGLDQDLLRRVDQAEGVELHDQERSRL